MPFIHFRKTRIFVAAWDAFLWCSEKGLHAAAVWPVSQKCANRAIVAPLFWSIEKSGSTHARFCGVCENWQTAAAWRSLFSWCKKVNTTHARFAHFRKTPNFAAAWYTFQGLKISQHWRTVCSFLKIAKRLQRAVCFYTCNVNPKPAKIKPRQKKNSDDNLCDVLLSMAILWLNNCFI